MISELGFNLALTGVTLSGTSLLLASTLEYTGRVFDLGLQTAFFTGVQLMFFGTLMGVWG